MKTSGFLVLQKRDKREHGYKMVKNQSIEAEKWASKICEMKC